MYSHIFVTWPVLDELNICNLVHSAVDMVSCGRLREMDARHFLCLVKHCSPG